LQPLTEQLGWQLEEEPPFFTHWNVRFHWAPVLHCTLAAISGNHCTFFCIVTIFPSLILGLMSLMLCAQLQHQRSLNPRLMNSLNFGDNAGMTLENRLVTIKCFT